MTPEELKQFDGRDGRKAYVAYKGKIYDVTESRLWKQGQHVKKHFAGRDLTDDLAGAPHGDDVFASMTYIGELEEGKMNLTGQERMQELYRKLHPHPMFIHFPVALFNFALLMQLSYIFTGKSSYENAGFYAVIVGVMSVLPAIASGFFSWVINYNSTMTKIFRIKIIFSVLLLLNGIVCILVRFYDPSMAVEGGNHMSYTLLVALNLPLTATIGYNGGKLTWGG